MGYGRKMMASATFSSATTSDRLSAATATAAPLAYLGRHCHSKLPSAAIGGHSLGIYTVTLRPLLSFSAKMTVSPLATRASFAVPNRSGRATSKFVHWLVHMLQPLLIL